MDKEEVKTNVSSLLVATKGAITPHQLNSTIHIYRLTFSILQVLKKILCFDL